MQTKSILLLTSLILLTLAANAETMSIKVIYGEDNRVDVFESRNALYLDLAESTAAMIKTSLLKDHNSCEYKVEGKSLKERGMCESERFSKQFLICFVCFG